MKTSTSQQSRSFLLLPLFGLVLVAAALLTRPLKADEPPPPAQTESEILLKDAAWSTGMSAGYSEVQNSSERSFSDGYGSRAVVNPCPLDLGDFADGVRYQQNRDTETWKTSSAASCQDVATVVLIALRDGGYELVKSSYLDLAGEAWGCAVRCPDGSSLMITLVPEALGRSRGENNLLVITITHTFVPDLEGELVGVDGS